MVCNFSSDSSLVMSSVLSILGMCDELDCRVDSKLDSFKLLIHSDLNNFLANLQ